MAYLITTDFPQVAKYVVALDDKWGFTPLFAVSDFDKAHNILVGIEGSGIAWTEESQLIMDAI